MEIISGLLRLSHIWLSLRRLSHIWLILTIGVKVVMSLILLVALSRAIIWRERTLRFDDGISAAFI